ALPRLQAVGARATFYLTAGLMDERRAPWWDELAGALEHARAPRLAAASYGGAHDLPLGTEGGRRAALRAVMPTLRVAPDERERRLLRLRAALGVPEPARCELATWDTAQALVRAGMEVGAHTLTHPHLTTLDPGAQAREIA